MPHAEVLIIREGDPPPWGDIESPDLVYLSDGSWRVAILSGGMTSGLPSIALRLDLPNLNDHDDTSHISVVAESSLQVLIAIMAAARGAFPEAFAGGPFEQRD